MYISSKDNPRIKKISKLLSSKKERSAEGLFVIEGMRGVIDAVNESLRGHLELECVYLAEGAAEAFSDRLGTEVLGSLPEEKRVTVPVQLAQKISSEGNTQGAFAVARALHKPLPERLEGNKYLVLDNLQDPGNLGTILRSADAVGADGVILSANCTELYNPKTVRSTMGSMARLNIYIENDFTKAIACLKASGVKTVAAVVRGGELVSKFRFPERCAVIIGNEGRGMSDEHISLCDKHATIDMKGNIESLNASVAAAVFLWEMTKER